jgi:hypothetical protein
MKKTSVLILSALLLNVWGSAAEVDLGDHSSAEPFAKAMEAVKKTGRNPAHPRISKAFESVLATKIVEAI